MFFIKPNPSFFDGTDMVPASKLTAAKDAKDCLFCLHNIAEIDNHESADNQNLESIVADRMKRNPRLWRFVLDCCTDICRCRSRMAEQTIENECGVQYVYGDPVMDMLVDGHGCCMKFEETVEGFVTTTTAVSENSRTDYICWKVYGTEDNVYLRHRPMELK